MAGVTNTDIMAFLQGTVLSGLDGLKVQQGKTNTHLATLNGTVANLQRRSGDHGDRLEEHNGQLAELDKRVSVHKAVDELVKETQDEDRKEAKGERKELRLELWATTKKVIAVGFQVSQALALIALAAKAMGGW